MKIKQTRWLIACTAVSTAAFLIGCGGGSGTNSGTGRLSLTVVWPKTGRLIPIGSTSILAVVTSGTQTVGSKLIVGTDGAPSSPQVVTFNAIPAGAVTLTATAFPNEDGSGVAQATGAQPVTILSDQTAQVTVTMASTIDHVTITPANPTITIGPFLSLTMTAFDATGAMVLTPLTAHFVDGNPAVLKYVTSGGTSSFQGLEAGTSLVTVTETESGKSANTTVTVTAPPANQIAAWGDNTFGQATGSPAGSGFTNIGGSGSGAFALKADGGIIGWGLNISGEVSNIPTGTGFTAIANDCNGANGYALRADGSIAAWGDNQYGQVSGTPSGTGFKAIAANGTTGYALRADGSIASWGNSGAPTNAPIATGFTAIAIGFVASFALHADGSIAAWGSDTNGEISNAPTGIGFVAIAAGYSSGYALKANGTITAWGANVNGEVTSTPSSTGFTAITGGYQFAMALRADGSIAAWGRNVEGEISNTPTGTGFTAIVADGSNGYALRGVSSRSVPSPTHAAVSLLSALRTAAVNQAAR